MVKFKIGTEKHKPEGSYRPVYLDDNEFYHLDTTAYMGFSKQNEMEGLRKALCAKFGYEVDMRQINAALILGQISETKPN
jgi:hypothetical protein